MLKWLVVLLLFFPFWIFSFTKQTDYFLVILVDGRRLDYSNGKALFRTMAKHPSDRSKNGDVGHAWIYLQGIVNGQPIYIEGGHSGEVGNNRPKYFEGVINYHEYGYSDPSEEERTHPRYEPNPVKYLWTSPRDGFFQKGCGGHVPTFAAKIDITPRQFQEILAFIHPNNYNYKEYSITENQCSSFAAHVAGFAGLVLRDKVTMKIEPSMKVFGGNIRLWSDLQYSTITFSSPDVLERGLRLAVQEGFAEDATEWYKHNFSKTYKECFNEWCESFWKLPERWSRALLIQ